MPRDFWNKSEFDESEHLTTREIWDLIGKYMFMDFSGIVRSMEVRTELLIKKLKKEDEEAKQLAMSGQPESPAETLQREKEKEQAEKIFNLIKEYYNVELEEEGARANREKDPQVFLEKRRDLIWEQQKMIKAFRLEFVERALKVLDALASKRLKQINLEDNFRGYDAGIMPVKASLRKERSVLPDFIRATDGSEGGIMLDEGILKLWKRELEIIDERLHQKEKPY